MADLPIRQDALLDPASAQRMVQRISQLTSYGKQYWLPLHRRMDYWASMYLLLDQLQQMKPLGWRRFISNEPRCVTPETRILTADARWIPAGDLYVGQQLLAFEDEPTRKSGRNVRGLRARHHRRATVTHKELKTAPVYKITLVDGRTVRSTGEHKWLSRVANERGAITWVSTEEMARHYARKGTSYPGKHGANAGRIWLAQYFEPWDNGEDDRDTGYLAGAFDADGSVYRKVASNHYPMVQFTQCDNACLHELSAALTRKGFSYNTSVRRDPKGGQLLHHLYLNGGRSEILRFLGQIRPPRLLERFGGMQIDDVELRAIGNVEVLSVEPDGDAPIVALTSSSGTYLTEYGASHNTAVDSAVAIMTRNDAFWRIDLNQLEAENQDERLRLGKIERTLQGIVNDLDEMFSMRFDMPLWKQAAYQALLRGWIWGKFHVTKAALDYRESPIIAEVYDSRMVYPKFDQYGLSYVIIEKLTTLGDVESTYPGVYADITNGKDYDPNRLATKVEFWSNDRGNLPGITGTLCVVGPTGSELPVPIQTSGQEGIPAIDAAGANARWLIPPHRHGYDQQSLPVIGVPVNGVPIKHKPAIPAAVATAFASRADLFDIHTRSWHGAHTQVAESGRSILANVEESVPQSNELIATIFQHFSLETYPTYLIKTPTGELPNFEPNLNARIPLRPEESIERLQTVPISADAFRLMEILQQEKQQGTLSSILRATLPLGGGDLGSGILFAQMTNAALNGLEPFHDGLEMFGKRMGTSLIRQLQLSATEIKPFTISVPFKQNTFFDIEFDPKVDLESGRKYRARPVFQPALPDDMHIRIQMARLALDPRRPVLSLVTVLEDILRRDDPQGEADRMWEDLANQDPIIVLEQVAQALERHGEAEMAARVRENEFRLKFIQDMQFRQIAGAVPGLGGGGGGEPPPERLGPEGGTPGSTTRNEGSPERHNLRQEGMSLVGAMGERRGP